MEARQQMRQPFRSGEGVHFNLLSLLSETLAGDVHR